MDILPQNPLSLLYISKEINFNYVHQINNTPLARITAYKHRGLMLAADLKLNTRNESVASKVRSKHIFLSGSLRYVSPDVKLTIYSS